NPGTEGPRKRLLEAALLYYGKIIEERQDDPGAQAELAKTKEHVETILKDLAALQGAWIVPLLGQPTVQDDLRLTEEQRTKISELSQRLGSWWNELGREFARLSPEERKQRFVEQARASDTEVRQILNLGQQQRTQQIALQLQGVSAFRDPDVAAALKL